MTDYRGYTPDVAASVYCLDYGKGVDAIEARIKTCALCGDEFDPQDGGRQVWNKYKMRYRYICPMCWEMADEIEED